MVTPPSQKHWGWPATKWPAIPIGEAMLYGCAMRRRALASAATPALAPLPWTTVGTPPLRRPRR
eukprot:2009173-Lingulodinium_polyedra.AAC.1